MSSVARSRRRSIVAPIALSISITLLIAAICYTVEAFREYDRFQRANWTPTSNFVVDLSKPGTYRAPLHHTYGAAHEHHFLIELPDKYDDYQNEGVFDGLKGSVRILDDTNKVISTVELPSKYGANWWYYHNEFLIAELDKLEAGTYQIELQVDEPAPALSNLTMAAKTRYMMCGNEPMVAILPAVVLVIAWLLSAIIPGGIYLTRKWRGRAPS